MTESSEVQNHKPKKISIFAGVIISTITILFCLSVLEIIAWIWEKNTAQDHLGWTMVAARRIKQERHGSDLYPYYLMTPNQNYNWEGISVDINSQGFRGPEFSPTKQPGVIRILNLGDSVAFGWEVAYQDTYGARLDLLLENENLAVEVINAGVPAWNIDAERNFLIQEGLSYQPDLVVLDLTLVNDIYGAGPVIVERQNIFQWLRDHTYFWPFLTIQARYLLARNRGPEAIPVLNPPTDAQAYFPTEYDSPVWDEFWSKINEIAIACQEQEIPLLIIVFPTAFQLNSANHTRIPQDVLSDKATSAGIPFVDLLPIYEDTCENAEDGACEGYENLLFADVWMHPNALGHQLAADALMPVILANIDN